MVRKEAIDSILERNPDAFRPKIQEGAGGRHNKGCACKRSFCLKRYCECYQAGILCSENCKCVECKNFKESDDRKALMSTDTHGPMPGPGGALKKLRLGDPSDAYTSVAMESPSGTTFTPPAAAQPVMPMAALPLIVQMINQPMLETVCHTLVNVALCPESSKTNQGGMCGVEGLPALSTNAVPRALQAGADTLVCHEKMGPSPSPDSKVGVAPPASPPSGAVVKSEMPINTETASTIPSSRYITREKAVLTEFHKCLSQLAGTLREKLQEKDAKKHAASALNQVPHRLGASGLTPVPGFMPVPNRVPGAPIVGLRPPVSGLVSVPFQTRPPAVITGDPNIGAALLASAAGGEQRIPIGTTTAAASGYANVTSVPVSMPTSISMSAGVPINLMSMPSSTTGTGIAAPSSMVQSVVPTGSVSVSLSGAPNFQPIPVVSAQATINVTQTDPTQL